MMYITPMTSKIDTYKEIIEYFLAIKEIQKDSLQVKLQQSFITLIQPDYIHFANFHFVEKVCVSH
jgi:hypothetical protein